MDQSHRQPLAVLRAALTFCFLYYGGRKLLGAEADVTIYEAIGFGQWPRPITGSVEVVSALLLWVPGLIGLGGALLVATMIVGTSALVVFTDLPFLHLPALGAAAAVVAWQFRRDVLERTRL